MSSSLPALPGGKAAAFLQTREGKICLTGALIAGGILCIYNGVEILNYILTMMQDLEHIGILAIEMIVTAFFLFSKRMHILYRAIIRFSLGWLIALAPLDIIMDKVITMKKRKAKMEDQIGVVKGQRVGLQNQMAKNKKEADQGMMNASFAKSHDKERAARLNARAAERRTQANIGFQPLLDKLLNLEALLAKFSDDFDYVIQDTEDAVNVQKTTYKATSAALGALKMAMSFIKGNPVEEDMYAQAWEDIQNTIDSNLGNIDNLTRLSKDFVDNMDIQTGSADESAMKALEAFEKKLALPGGDGGVAMIPGSSRQPVPVPVSVSVSRPSSLSDDYENLIK
jgi:hypothetical protein